MAKGTRVGLNYQVSHDPDTGAEVTRSTPPEVTYRRGYFYQECFFDDGSHLLLADEFDGYWNYYLLNVASTGATQLAEGIGNSTFGGSLSPDGKSLYYVKNDRTLLEVNLTTLVRREVCRVSDDWVGYGTWVASSDCSKLVDTEITKSDWTPLNNWQVFRDFFHKGSRCRLLRVDLHSGESQVIHEEKIWLGHPICRPFDDHTAASCYKGPHDLVGARMWLVNEDGSHVRKVKTHAPGESCTHEFWVSDGLALIYVSYLKGQQGRTIYHFNPENGVNEALVIMPACSHLMSNFNDTLLAGDGSGTPVDVKDTGGHSIDNDPYLYVFDVVQKHYFRVTRRSTSWTTVANSRQVTHPYPSLTPDDSAILFSSGKNGKPTTYIAKLPEYPPMLSA